MKVGLCSLLLILGLSGLTVLAAEPPNSLDELLQQVRREGRLEQKANAAREARFLAEKNQQTRVLKKAKATFAAEEQRSNALKETYENNEKKLSELETHLKERLGSLGELFGIVRQYTREAEGILNTSLVSAQLPGRSEAVGALSRRKQVPSIDELEGFWFALQEEMTESGKIVRFPASVITMEGQEAERMVTRVGVFTATSDGKYLRYLPETGRLVELSRQPSARFQAMALRLEQATTGIIPMAVDPSRGAILSLLVQSPDYRERLQQGGVIGYLILAIGFVALLLVGERFVYFTIAGKRIMRQMKSDVARMDNALGRIMRIYTGRPDRDVQTLSHKLDEAILKETPKVERGLRTIAILAAVAPLLGLLGTVTGMIETFQSITLFGTGDPKLMSGGISQALVTTELGLMVAVPIILLHSLLLGKSNRLIQILDEQSAGMVARLSEKHHGATA